MLKRDNIALIGFMGSGKSTIGGLLSHKTSLPMIDLDHRVETTTQYSIEDLWTKHGEEVFRIYERMELLRLFYSGGPHILATGGGTPTFYNNMEILNQYYKTFWLDVSFYTAQTRVEADKSNRRPLFDQDDLLNLFENRNHTYSLANYRINAEFPPDVILNTIISILSE